MASAINFYAGAAGPINNLSGSGLGFFGSNGFGYSVSVGSYNGRTFITDSTGTNQGPEAANCQWLSTSGVVFGQTGSGILLTQLPNYLATLNIEFTNDTPVKVQNVQLYGYDRVSQNNDPSGVTMQVAEIRHPTLTQTNNGSGSNLWTPVHGSGSVLTLSSGPGTSGLSPNGPNTVDARHDFYTAISCSPQSVGSKTFGLYFSCEFL